MGRLLDLRRDPHEQTQQSLPWYVTGQIEPAERVQVDAHLATCSACRDELVFEYRLGAALRDVFPGSGDPGQRVAVAPRENSAWLRRPVRVAWFLGAQAAVVLLCVGLFTVQRAVAPDPAYRALGDQPVLARGNMLVMFVPGAPAQSRRDAIRLAHARLVSGPTAVGAYVLTVAPNERVAALARLRATPDVTLAQPIDAPAS